MLAFRIRQIGSFLIVFGSLIGSVQAEVENDRLFPARGVAGMLDTPHSFILNREDLTLRMERGEKLIIDIVL